MNRQFGSPLSPSRLGLLSPFYSLNRESVQKPRLRKLVVAQQAVDLAVVTPVADYLLEQRGIDWASSLKPWAWLLPSEFTIWLVNRFADLFLVLPDGTVHLLDVGLGTLTKVAESREDFVTNLAAGDHANQWLMIPLVDQAVSAGIELSPGECYGFKSPPVLGGEYNVENCGRLSVADYLGACGSIHDQLRDVADGSQIVLKVIEAHSQPNVE